MLAVKRGKAATARAILEFGIDPAVLLLRDADGSTPLHVAVQNADTVITELFVKHGPTQLLYTENCVGQTPLDIASLKGLPRIMTSSTEINPAGTLAVLPWDDRPHYLSREAPLFDVEKQKVEIPKLRATLDTLLADGTIVPGTKLATELLAFAHRMEGRLTVETARKDAIKKRTEEGNLDPLMPQEQDATARTYFALHNAAATRPGTRQLVHLADVQRSVQWNLAQQAVSGRNQHSQATEETKKTDPEDQRITELKARSLLLPSLAHYDPMFVDLYGEDKL